MYTVDSGASLNLMRGEDYLSAGKENHTTDQTLPSDSNREWHIPFHTRRRIYIKELGTHWYVKLVEYSSPLSTRLSASECLLYVLMLANTQRVSTENTPVTRHQVCEHLTKNTSACYPINTTNCFHVGFTYSIPSKIQKQITESASFRVRQRVPTHVQNVCRAGYGHPCSTADDHRLLF